MSPNLVNALKAVGKLTGAGVMVALGIFVGATGIGVITKATKEGFLHGRWEVEHNLNGK